MEIDTGYRVISEKRRNVLVVPILNNGDKSLEKAHVVEGVKKDAFNETFEVYTLGGDDGENRVSYGRDFQAAVADALDRAGWLWRLERLNKIDYRGKEVD